MERKGRSKINQREKLIWETALIEMSIDPLGNSEDGIIPERSQVGEMGQGLYKLPQIECQPPQEAGIGGTK